MMVEEGSGELCPEPILDNLLRQNKVIVESSYHLSQHQTVIHIRFNDEDLRRMDRQQFRRLLSERLNQAGDALMTRWDQLYEEKE